MGIAVYSPRIFLFKWQIAVSRGFVKITGEKPGVVSELGDTKITKSNSNWDSKITKRNSNWVTLKLQKVIQIG